VRRFVTLRERVAALPVSRRIEILSGRDFWRTEAIPELDLPAIMLTDGPHGLRRQPDGADHLGIGTSVPATCFPTASALGSTWDVELLDEVGRALGRECRSQRVAVLLGPALNIKRHPACGRNFEYLSEDPLLSGRLAAALVKGIQSQGVAACLKHYAANNHETRRMVSDSIIDERTLREIYLAGFEIAVKQGHPWTVMTSYNQINGEYVSDSRRLVADVLRGEWGFEGLVVTDWGGTHDRAASVAAGVDLEMPSSGGAHDGEIRDALDGGQLTDDDITDRATTVASLAARCVPPTDDSVATFDIVDHHRLARRVASAGTVLLSNDGTLPLDPAVDVAVIGEFAVDPRYQGAGSSQVVPTRIDDARLHLEERISGHVRYAAGYDAATGETTPALLREATELAIVSDVAVVFVGLPAVAEAEGIDRSTLALPTGHDELIEAVCAANGRTIVVLSNGAPVLMPWVERAAAVVEGHLGGQAGGSAIVEVLTGDSEPGGRLAETIPASMVFPSEENFAGGRQVEYREGLHIGYRFFDRAGVAPRFPFGHGLSYTTFDYGEIAVSGGGSARVVELTVTNEGERAGSDVVQVYVRDVESSVYRPDKELRGFAKVNLEPGESSDVRIPLDERAFAYYDVDTGGWAVEGGDFDVLVGASSTDIRGCVSIAVEGDAEPRPQPGPSGPGFVATDAEFEAMLGHPIPTPTPILPFTRDTLVEELGVTRLGRTVQRGILRIADRQLQKMLGDDPDPVVVKLSEAMIRESPLRFLITMSGGVAPSKAFDGLAGLLSALRIAGRRGRPLPSTD
jgi:beta-glucosidase